MLERHVDIGHDVGEARHRFREAAGDTAGVGVHQPHPGQIGHGLGKLLEQDGETVAVTAVLAVGRGVLGDQDEFARTRGRVELCLGQQSVRRVGVHAALDRGDDAEGAGAIAAVGDLEVGAGSADVGERRLGDVEAGARGADVGGDLVHCSAPKVASTFGIAERTCSSAISVRQPTT